MSVDMNTLPPDIQAYIQAEIAKALAANQPAPPRELTPAEKARLAHSQAVASLSGEKQISAGSLYAHDRILAALEHVIAKVFPEETESDSTPAEAPAEAEGQK